MLGLRLGLLVGLRFVRCFRISWGKFFWCKVCFGKLSAASKRYADCGNLPKVF